MLDRLISSPKVDTRDPDEFRRTLFSLFGAERFELRSRSNDFRVTRNFFKLPSLDLVVGSCSVPYLVHFPSTELVKQHFVLKQSGRTRFGGTEFNISENETAVIPAGIEMVHEYEAGLEQFILRIDGATLQSKLSAITGIPIARSIEFCLPSLFANPALRRLRRMLEFMVSEFDHPEDGKLSPTALAEFEQLLLVSFLTGNRHNFSELMECEQPSPAPWQVRLVEEFIAANWNRPITVEVLAEASGASTRSIFKAFRDWRHCSPMAFVKSVRLGHARRMLQQPDQATSVVSVAFACGFLNPGHFARDYRLAFGELPSLTLAQSRHRRH